ncbi:MULTISPECIES: ABC transporter substrate-binding protein [Klebsiella]|nr:MULTISPECIES: ABC transporter substrate-binding protein [Klebsiella]EIX9221283.1 ABC transporter substrate-binding protein [Klebsiella pneumoniae]EIX9429557.1 ABC transporter substrate-binding protein [Klebsiella pneumoniae]EIX9523352.1 ABC transporter substrate-binding protein [Klebsiella pneumoniae]EIX9569687.1 ABC transporter substrate-binding protein [Klebsiella pneumoniae]EIX9646939.1 ABC transporter substrate-binding protein [Klebsiella pneumoniae]
MPFNQEGSMRWFVSLLLLLTGAVSAAAPQTQIFTDDLGRTVTVPLHPQRIVSMHDLDITIPLIELGAPPIASHGRTRPDGSHYLRSSAQLTGVDFDNSDIRFIGTADIDLEAVAAARPDLIITEPSRHVSVEQLEKIAPTVSIDHLQGSAPEIYRKLAQLTGTQPRLAILERRYQEQIKQLKAMVNPPQYSVSVIQANNGKVTVHHSYHALGRVLRDAGFRFPPLIERIPDGQRIDVSAEQLPELDADFVFATWRSDTGGKPQDELQAMEGVMPGWCDFLRACRTGHYILLPREEVISNSYAALSLMVAQVQSHIAGRPIPAEAK